MRIRTKVSKFFFFFFGDIKINKKKARNNFYDKLTFASKRIKKLNKTKRNMDTSSTQQHTD